MFNEIKMVTIKLNIFELYYNTIDWLQPSIVLSYKYLDVKTYYN